MRRRNLKIAILLALSCLGVTGCGQNNIGKGKEVELAAYEKLGHEVVSVEKGDLEPEFSFKISAYELVNQRYTAPKDEMKIKSFNHEVGDIVNEGDILLEFENEELDHDISEYTKRLDEDNLLLAHYERLIELGSQEVTEESINFIKEDMAVCNAYISELSAQKAQYNIVASGRGVITLVGDMVSYGTVNANDALVNVVYGQGLYYVEMKKDPDLIIGNIYEAEYLDTIYKMKLIAIEEAGEEADKDYVKYIFEYQDGMGEIPIYTILDMVIKRKQIKDAVYIPEKAVYEIDDEKYAIVLAEDGYGYLRKIEVLSVMNDIAIIGEGLTENERVVLR